MEDIKNEVVEKAEEKLFEAATNLDQAIAENKVVQTLTEPKGFGTKNLLIGTGLTLGGVAGGFALDRWVIPWAKKTIECHKKKKALKKAAKQAKKAAKVVVEPASTEVPAKDDGDLKEKES